MALAGCGGNGSTTPTDTGTWAGTSTPKGGPSRVTGQTFQAPTSSHPQKTAFYGWGSVSMLQDTAYAAVAKEPASYSLRRFLRPPGVWIDGPLVAPDPDASIQYIWLEEPIEISPTEVTVTVSDGAAWSDGHPITGRDIALRPLEWTLRRFLLPAPAYAPEKKGPGGRSDEGPQRVLSAFDDFEIGDRSVTYTSSAGHFDRFYDRTIALWFAPIYPSLSPTHIEPFATFADAVVETTRKAQSGEVYPWYGAGFGDPHRKSLIEDHLTDPEYVRRFANPENVLATGAWDLVGLDGTEFVFEPNEHHPAADGINFEELRFAYTADTRRLHAAVEADRMDFGLLGTAPQSVVDAFPKSIEVLRVPAGGTHSGIELGVDLAHPALGNLTVRRAIMHLLDQPTIATNVHESLTVPVTTPGGDCWKAEAYAKPGLLEEGFITYDTTRDRAARLMREADYVQESGTWVGTNGEPLSLTLPTTSSTPTWEPAVASQLTEFGIDTSVRQLEDGAFRRRLDAGEFAIWPSQFATAASSAPQTLFIWQRAARNPDKYGIYPDEEFETGDFSRNGTPIPRTEERYRVFTVQAPPVGEPDGSLQPFHPAALSLAFSTNPPLKEFRRRIRVGMWLANWLLPTLPITKLHRQQFIDDAHWLWPTNSRLWKSLRAGDAGVPNKVLGTMPLRANPDNPEQA